MGIMKGKLTDQAFQKLITNKFQHQEMELHTCGLPQGGMLLIWDQQRVHLEVKKWKEQYIHNNISCKSAQNTYAITFVYDQFSN